MKLDWQQIEKLYHSALELEPRQRQAFLREACAGDEALRREVESLLAHQDQAESFIEAPALEVAAKGMAQNRAPSLVGRQVGPYKIHSLLGVGGMGEVYLAQDPRLDRAIALKILPTELASDPDRIRRFIREARAASGLKHPNVATIYEIGKSDEFHFIAMEYVEGQTLADKISGRPLPIAEIVDIGIQVADALDEAHRKGITHRDIKPANLMLTSREQVKILDFGLAKVTRPEGQAMGSDISTVVKTETGVVMGTVQYMSPEQVLGKEVDHRTDIFSLGVVLYEMATGRLPFTGTSSSETMDRVLHGQPEAIARFNYNVPAELERIIRKCLEKDRERRYQSARDLLIDLKNLKRDSDSGKAAEVLSRRERWEERLTFRRPHWRWAWVALLPVLVAGFFGWQRWNPARPPRPLRAGSGTEESQTLLTHATFTQLTDQPGPELFPSLSPDGKSFVYASAISGNWDIYLQRVGGKIPVNLTKDSPFADTHPAISPDGERIVFRSEREGGGIFVMGATGESVKRLTDFGHNPAWSPEGTEVLCAIEGIETRPETRLITVSQLWSVNVSTGEKRLITKGDGVQPHWSPHGHRIAYWARHREGQSDIWTVPARAQSNAGAPVPVTNDAYLDWNPVWSSEGNYLYFLSDRGGSRNLWRVRIDEESGKVLGQPEPVSLPSSHTGHVSLSGNGRRIAYVQQASISNLQKAEFDPSRETIVGQPVWLTQGSKQLRSPDFSPDGQWLTFTSRGKQEDLFIIRTDGTGLRQLTDDIHSDRWPRWSPDGKWIAFYSTRSGKSEIWIINPDGSGLQQLTHGSDGEASYPVWSPDGKHLAFYMKAVKAKTRSSWKSENPGRSRLHRHCPHRAMPLDPSRCGRGLPMEGNWRGSTCVLTVSFPASLFIHLSLRNSSSWWILELMSSEVTRFG